MNLAPKQRGFTMIELMISVVVGLVVSGAAVLLVAAIVKSNAETLRASRLTQELRATTEIISRELRRARSVCDPIANVDQSSRTTSYNTIDTATASCLKLAYETSCDATPTGHYWTFGLVSGSVRMASSSSSAPACPASGSSTISSAAVNVTALSFSHSGDDYTITITGQPTYRPTTTDSATLATLTRSYTQHVQIRSASIP